MADVVVDQAPRPQLPYDPADIPEAVKKRVAAVEALYQHPPELEAPAEPAPPAAAEPEPPPPPPAESAPESPPTVSSPNLTLAPVPEPPSVAPPPIEDENAKSWKDRALSWQGRYNAAQKTNAELNEQLAQMGRELYETQQLLSRRSARTASNGSAAPSPAFLTDQDVQNYGSELVDFTQRAAAHAVAPRLQRIEQENAQLRENLSKEARHRLDQSVEAAVPNYREVDANPRWHKWLLGLDIYSGRVRQHLLNDAIAAADAHRVVSFFRGFIHDEAATGHTELAPTSQPAASQPPREPAVPLASLAAPGRPRPASGGESSMPLDKPQYTRAQIAQLYRQHQKGAYVGREAEWNRLDADIIAAGREGRIR